MIKIIKNISTKLKNISIKLKNKEEIEKIVWNGAKENTEQVINFFKDTNAVYQIRNGDKKWDNITQNYIFYTEPFLLYVDDLGGYIDIGTVIYKIKINNRYKLFVDTSFKLENEYCKKSKY